MSSVKSLSPHTGTTPTNDENIGYFDNALLVKRALDAGLRSPVELSALARVDEITKPKEMVEFAQKVGIRKPAKLGEFAISIGITKSEDLDAFARASGITNDAEMDEFTRSAHSSYIRKLRNIMIKGDQATIISHKLEIGKHWDEVKSLFVFKYSELKEKYPQKDYSTSCAITAEEFTAETGVVVLSLSENVDKEVNHILLSEASFLELITSDNPIHLFNSGKIIFAVINNSVEC